jgi:hypothetical protein
MNIMNSMNCLDHCTTEHRVAPAQHVPKVRVEKVLSVRRQLGEGRYCVTKKLNVVVDRLLEDLLQHNGSEDDSQR